MSRSGGDAMGGPMSEPTGDLTIEALSGKAVVPWLDHLAELRIRVFRDWPYLYDGDLAYERDYLEQFSQAPDQLLVLARSSGSDNAAVVGCSTGLALRAADQEFQQPFIEAGIALDSVFYFGESVLDRAWRGRGAGHRFFDLREQHALDKGYRTTTFCAVERPADHPLAPADYRPLEGFWRKRGYRPQAQLQSHFAWKDIDQPGETRKPMQFWLRSIRDAAQS